jgi:hypothetical protein
MSGKVRETNMRAALIESGDNPYKLGAVRQDCTAFARRR